jgi:hypothetical protein
MNASISIWRLDCLASPAGVGVPEVIIVGMSYGKAMISGFSCENVTLRFPRCVTRLPIARQTSF